ncbi:MAG: hypothetical protein GIX02_14120 [Candidatus Eremiobacteraeota bacterium]|nr:hypothetical protein [Candidatus Eremiobacteraeota bacterium]
MKQSGAGSLLPLAAACALLLSATPPANAFTLHSAVSLNARAIEFFAGHVVLDAQGGAAIDDGVLHVSADRIVLDLRANRYVGVGHVTLSGSPAAEGAALGVDVLTHRAVLISVGPHAATQVVEGKQLRAAAAGDAGSEPLALPDLEGELPYAVATSAVAHAGADVRLRNAHVVVPGGRSVYLPSYVYTFSSDTGYVVNNAYGGGEDVPLYVGSTRDSIQGLHFFYNAQTKVGVGFDDHIVDGNKAYVLISLSPLNGPSKALNFTWQEHINSHASQSFAASAQTGSSVFSRYDVNDQVHRSFFELSAYQTNGANAQQISWQSLYEPLGSRGLPADVYFNLRSEFGLDHAANPGNFYPFSFSGATATTVAHTALEAQAYTKPFTIGESTLNLTADLRRSNDSLPHDRLIQTYGVQLTRRWNQRITTQFLDGETSVHDDFRAADVGASTHTSTQSLGVTYDHGDPFALYVSATHNAAWEVGPTSLVVTPWSLYANARFRVNRSLSLGLSRSYYFGFEGQRFSSFGVQIFP